MYRHKNPLRIAREQVLPGDPDTPPPGPPICWICGYRGATTRDHLIPVSTDWTDLDIPSHPGHSPANLAWAHYTCNVSRSTELTADTLAYFHERCRTLPVAWYPGTYAQFVTEVEQTLALAENRAPFIYRGGPLDGQVPLTTRATYKDHTGSNLPTPAGDAFIGKRNRRNPRPGIYSHQRDGYHWRDRSDFYPA